MKKILILTLAVILAACSAAAPATSATPQVDLSSISPAVVVTTTSSPIPSFTPTPFIGTNKVYLVDGVKPNQDNASIVFFTSEGKRIACPKGECAHDENIALLTGGEQVQVVLLYDWVSGRYEVGVLPEGQFAKIKVNNSIVVLYYANNTYLSVPTIPIREGLEKVDSKLAKQIADTKALMDGGHACIVSGARFGEIYECSIMPTLTPSPITTNTLPPTIAPTNTPITPTTGG